MGNGKSTSERNPASARVMCVLGTRPEAIKMAPVIEALRATAWAQVAVVTTAQHRELTDEVLSGFGIRPDFDLDLMRPDQSLASLTARLLEALDVLLSRESPDLVLVQGDTTTAMSGALTAFYRRIRVGHVEAGLRTGDRAHPFPEEVNREFVGRLADLHFAPTRGAAEALLREGVAANAVFVTGNTVVDALLAQVARSERITLPLDPSLRTVLVTIHRRENFGAPLLRVCAAIRALVERFQDIQVLVSVHPNPRVASVVSSELSGKARVVLSRPLDYLSFVAAMERSTLILSDSGGIQEEAPALGKPVLVLREKTERPGAVAAGVARLVGTDEERILEEASLLLRSADAYSQMAHGGSPFGDGQASRRIVEVLKRNLIPADRMPT